MLKKSNVAAASALCVLSWTLIIGFSAGAHDQGGSEPELIIIVGQAGQCSIDASTGEAILEIDDGLRTWSCVVGGAPHPEAGSQVVACCALSPGGLPEIIHIACL